MRPALFLYLSLSVLSHHAIALVNGQTQTLTVTSADGTRIFAEATGKYSNPHVVLTAGLSLSESIYHDFVKNPKVANSLYIVSIV